MQEVIQRVVDQAGISPEAAEQAVDAVIGYVKEHAPAPIASQIETILGSGAGTEAVGAAQSFVGGMFGKRDTQE